MRAPCSIALVIAVLAAAACGGEDGSGPYIDQIAPTAAARGAEVELLGVRFCGDFAEDVATDGSCVSPPNGFVHFGEDADVVRALVRSWASQRITVEVPQSAPVGATLVVVTVDGASSNGIAFEVQ